MQAMTQAMYAEQKAQQAYHGAVHNLAPKNESPIESAIARADYAIDQIRERIGDMERRLQPVMSPRMTGCEAMNGMAHGESPPTSPLQDSIDAFTQRLRVQNERMAELLAYLQL